MTMITPSYLGETIEYSSLHACRSTLEDPTGVVRSTHARRGGGGARDRPDGFGCGKADVEPACSDRQGDVGPGAFRRVELRRNWRGPGHSPWHRGLSFAHCPFSLSKGVGQVTEDPISSLDSFYDECRIAPVPERVLASNPKLRVWMRASIPFAGLAFGGLLAAALILTPAAPSASIGEDVAQSVAKIRIAAQAFAREGSFRPVRTSPPKPGRRIQGSTAGGTRWNV